MTTIALSNDNKSHIPLEQVSSKQPCLQSTTQ